MCCRKRMIKQIGASNLTATSLTVLIHRRIILPHVIAGNLGFNTTATISDRDKGIRFKDGWIWDNNLIK